MIVAISGIGPIGGARNLNLGGNEGSKCQGTGAIHFCVGQRSTIIFSYCVQQKDVTGFRDRAPGQGIRGAKPLKVETLSFWTFNGTRKFDI